MSANPFKHYEPKPHPLRSLFQEKGIRPITLANFCGVSKTHITEVLSGDRKCSQKLQAKLEEAALKAKEIR